MDYIWTTVIGIVAGLLAQDHARGHETMGYWFPATLGVVGATLGYLVSGWAGWTRGGQALGFVAAVIGASVVLAGFNTWRSLRRARKD
jgi:uncharacterized membrane protein YeaQ/YmgE (transglycosylase-associated protein family)